LPRTHRCWCHLQTKLIRLNYCGAPDVSMRCGPCSPECPAPRFVLHKHASMELVLHREHRHTGFEPHRVDLPKNAVPPQR
jgi:hypothetical protein